MIFRLSYLVAVLIFIGGMVYNFYSSEADNKDNKPSTKYQYQYFPELKSNPELMSILLGVNTVKTPYQLKYLEGMPVYSKFINFALTGMSDSQELIFGQVKYTKEQLIPAVQVYEQRFQAVIAPLVATPAAIDHTNSVYARDDLKMYIQKATALDFARYVNALCQQQQDFKTEYADEIHYAFTNYELDKEATFNTITEQSVAAINRKLYTSCLIFKNISYFKVAELPTTTVTTKTATDTK